MARADPAARARGAAAPDGHLYTSVLLRRTSAGTYRSDVGRRGACQHRSARHQKLDKRQCRRSKRRIRSDASDEKHRRATIAAPAPPLPRFSPFRPVLMRRCPPARCLAPISRVKADRRQWRSNTVFIPMPQMKSIDEPTDEGRSAFIDDLASTLRDTMAAFTEGCLPGFLPDTSSITWDGLAARLLTISTALASHERRFLAFYIRFINYKHNTRRPYVNMLTTK